jgi:hypothetical protein
VAYEKLAARVRALLADRTDVSERKMFGGLTRWVREAVARAESLPPT